MAPVDGVADGVDLAGDDVVAEALAGGDPVLGTNTFLRGAAPKALEQE
jgi:hypothetical protein